MTQTIFEIDGEGEDIFTKMATARKSGAVKVKFTRPAQRAFAKAAQSMTDMDITLLVQAGWKPHTLMRFASQWAWDLSADEQRARFAA